MKEIYALRPDEVELFHLPDGKTDMILRKDIQQTEDEDGNPRWECQEAQYQHDGILVLEDVARAFGLWWGVATASSADALSQAKQEKLKELSDICNATITAGVDVELEDGTHHFSMKQEDQINLLSLQTILAAGAASVPYHGDGEPCRQFNAQEFAAVVEAATAVKIYHESYYNSLRTYVEAMQDIYSVLGVRYGNAIPVEYQSEVYRALLRGNPISPAIPDDEETDEPTADEDTGDSASAEDTAFQEPEEEEPVTEAAEEQEQEPEPQNAGEDIPEPVSNEPEAEPYDEPDNVSEEGTEAPAEDAVDPEDAEADDSESDPPEAETSEGEVMTDETGENVSNEDPDAADEETTDEASDPVPDWSGDLL